MALPLSAGSIIPGLAGYSGLELIAHGSSAIVFRATQNRLNRKVAIKVLLVDDVMTTDATVRRELETLVQLSSSPHIVSIIDTGVTDAGQPYIVMEYCEGGSYAQILKERGPLPVEEVLEVGIKIGEALHAAHEAGIIHRDVKPPNILRSRFGPSLSDFGIAYAADELASTDTFYKLTPHHASPETLQQEHQTGQSDLYSLASTMWNLLAGRPPFANPGQDPEAFRQRVLRQPVPKVPRDDVPEWVQAELKRAMAKQPTDRHPTALAFAETLRLNMARSSMSTPWQPRSAPTSDFGVSTEGPTTQITRGLAQAPRSAPPVVSPGGSLPVLPSVSAPPANAPTTGGAKTPPVIIPRNAPTSSATTGRSAYPTSSTPLPVVLPGGGTRRPQTTPPAKPPVRESETESTAVVAAPPAAPPQSSPQAEPAQSATPRSAPPQSDAAETEVRPQAPRPVSAPQTYRSRPSHVPMAVGETSAPPAPTSEPGTEITFANGGDPATQPIQTWFEPATPGTALAVPPAAELTPYQRGYQTPEIPPQSVFEADDDLDEVDSFSWRRPLVTAGIIGIILGLVATIGIILASGKPDDPNDPKPTATPSFVDEGKPTNVGVSDGGATVTVQWKDNTNGKAPFLLVARPVNSTSGKDSVIGNSDKGTTSYTFSGLNPTVNYCIRITAVISNAVLTSSDNVCTQRSA